MLSHAVSAGDRKGQRKLTKTADVMERRCPAAVRTTFV